MTDVPRGVSPNRARPWPWSAASLVTTVIGTILGALLAWLYFESGTHCRDGWPELVAISYLILIVSPVIGVAMAHAGLHRGRAVRRGSSALGMEIAALALAWCVLVVVAGVVGFLALMMILFTNGLPC